jgi:hypothetical protein
MHLTDKLREIAGGILPKNIYGIMTQQSIVDRLGSQEQAVKLCREAICLADLGRKVNADYIAQARLGRFSGNLTIKIELYQVGNSNLIASFTEDAKDVLGLRSVMEARAPALFMSMPGVVEEPAPPVPAPVAEQPQSVVSLAQVLKGSLPSGCVEDFVSILEGEGFSMGKFVRDLPPAVAKVKVQMKSPFGKPKDDEKTSVGLSVGCIKSLPESPAEIQGLLKDIALKAGLDFVVEAVENDEVKEEKKGVRFGVRAGFNLNNFSFGYKDFSERAPWYERNSFGAGVALNFPVSIIRLNVVFDLYARALSYGEGDGGNIRSHAEDVVISVPVLFQFDGTFYFATGVQLDIPILEFSWIEYPIYEPKRSAMDFSFVLGLGYRFTNFELDFKYVYGLTDIFEDFSKSQLTQFGLGVSYFF